MCFVSLVKFLSKLGDYVFCKLNKIPYFHARTKGSELSHQFDMGQYINLPMELN